MGILGLLMACAGGGLFLGLMQRERPRWAMVALILSFPLALGSVGSAGALGRLLIWFFAFLIALAAYGGGRTLWKKGDPFFDAFLIDRIAWFGVTVLGFVVVTNGGGQVGDWLGFLGLCAGGFALAVRQRERYAFVPLFVGLASLVTFLAWRPQTVGFGLLIHAVWGGLFIVAGLRLQRKAAYPFAWGLFNATALMTFFASALLKMEQALFLAHRPWLRGELMAGAAFLGAYLANRAYLAEGFSARTKKALIGLYLATALGLVLLVAGVD
jgi:hypothetical protein